MKVVKVYGALKRLGQCRLSLRQQRRAIKALCVNFPGLDKWLIDSEKDGVGFGNGKRKSNRARCEPVDYAWVKKMFSITPVIAGAGRGLGSILARRSSRRLSHLAATGSDGSLQALLLASAADCNLRRCFGGSCWKYRHWPCLYGESRRRFRRSQALTVR